jgi:WD40 repeat protein
LTIPPVFFTGSHDNTVRIWEVASQQQVAELEGHTDTVMSVAFDSSGKYLASGEIA